VKSHTTVIIPFDDRVLFVCSLNGAEFPGRLSEVAQTLDAISRIQVSVVSRWLGEAWLLGAVRVSDRAGVGRWRLRSLTQFGYQIPSDMGHVVVVSFVAMVRVLDRYNVRFERTVRLIRTAQF
jgi:hypothetical protein